MKIGLAFRCFFNLLFGGQLSSGVLTELGLVKRGVPTAKAVAPAAVRTPADGALQILGALQRDARLVDFLMEDIDAHSDEQVGAAVRDIHKKCAESLQRYVKIAPLIDGVEGTFVKAPSSDPNVVKFVGNVPAKPPAGGTLQHKGWRATKVELPALAAGQDAAIIAPAEIEIE
jgi:hypothetical protein